jgi:hypothetical protein
MVQATLLAWVREHTPPGAGVQGQAPPACGCQAANVGAGRTLLGCPQNSPLSRGGTMQAPAVLHKNAPATTGVQEQSPAGAWDVPRTLFSQEVGRCKRPPCFTRAHPHNRDAGAKPRRGLGCPQNSFSPGVGWGNHPTKTNNERVHR